MRKNQEGIKKLSSQRKGQILMRTVQINRRKQRNYGRRKVLLFVQNFTKGRRDVGIRKGVEVVIEEKAKGLWRNGKGNGNVVKNVKLKTVVKGIKNQRREQKRKKRH